MSDASLFSCEHLIVGSCSVVDLTMRDGWVRDFLLRAPLPLAADALDLLCHEAEQASPRARDTLLSVVRVLLSEEALAQRLREEASGRALVALARFVRWPAYQSQASAPHTRQVAPIDNRVFSLGERKAMARRPDRRLFDRLLLDPHPDVIRMLLANPRLTEDDVVRLAARRPCFPDILAEIARTPRWSVRPRVRSALVLNPSTPPDIAVPMVLLLLRPELRLVVELTEANTPVRAAALELLRRRPPQLGDNDAPPDGELQ